MKDVIICTVGTALIRNLEKYDPSMISDRNAIAAAKRMKAEFEPSRYECGAEINSITSIVETNLVQDKHGLYLLISDTDDGQFVGQVLKHYYDREFEEVTVITLQGLHDQDFKDFRNRGLCNLVKETSRIIKREIDRGHHPVINATGGFKAQISFAGLIGQVLDVPVYYMFERFSRVIEMPPMPVTFDFSLWLENFPILCEISDRVIVPKNDPILEELYPKLSILLNYEDEGVMLSAMGELFHEGFYYRFFREGIKPPSPSGLTPKKKHQGFPDRTIRGLDDYFNRICEVDFVTKIQSFYYNPDLPSKNKFRKSTRGNDRVEGWFSNDGATATFDVFLTSNDPISAQVAIVYLTREICEQ